MPPMYIFNDLLRQEIPNNRRQHTINSGANPLEAKSAMGIIKKVVPPKTYPTRIDGFIIFMIWP
jgi:hypothetical protein